MNTNLGVLLLTGTETLTEIKLLQGSPEITIDDAD